MKLEILQDGEVVHTHPLGAAALHLGRSSANDLVLRGPGVSGHHAVVYRIGDEVRLRDLKSTNGTFHNGERLQSEVRLSPGDVLRFGEGLHARVADGGEVPAWRLRVEQLDGPLAWPVDRRVFPIPDTEVALRVGKDAVWLLQEGAEVGEVIPGQPFLDGRFRLRELTSTTQTVRPADIPLPYSLRVDLDSERAWLSESERTVVVRTANRVALLHALAHHWLHAVTASERGWMPDEQLGVAVWGRAHRGHLPNNINVLIHRVRKTVEDAGFDRWFIERRSGETRVHVARVALGPA